MTRINLVPPSELTDQHLFAEFREIKMIPKSLRRSLLAAQRRNDGSWYKAQVAVMHKIPKEFTLNKGHVSFFYDKGLYLMKRYSDICRELDLRGVRYDRNALLDPDWIYMELPTQFKQDYTPTPVALALIRDRIRERIQKQPAWYRLRGTPLHTYTAQPC
jgi:deoxyribonuclease (pyrimidine dimer)